MSNPPISVFEGRGPDPVLDDLDGWRKVEGEPSMKRWRQYVSDDQKLVCAWWQGMPGVYHATYNAWEFVHLLEGEIIITPDGDEPRRVAAGDTFIIEKGFSGTWEIRKQALKVCTVARI